MDSRTSTVVNWAVELGDDSQPDYDIRDTNVHAEPTDVNDAIGRLGPARRKKVEKRAAELIAEEMTRQELRRARERTQVQVAKALGINQDSVSRLEQRSDLLLSTLRSYVEALGGSLSLIAKFPDQEPVLLSGIGTDEVQTLKVRKRLKAAA